MLEILAGITVCVIGWIVYEVLWRKLNNFPPGPVGIPILGNILTVAKDPHKAVAALARNHGGITMLRLGTFKAVYLADPSLIKEFFITKGKHGTRFTTDSLVAFAQDEKNTIRGIVANVGSSYKKSRELMHATTFSKSVLQSKMLPVVVEELSEIMQHWSDNKGKEVDVTLQLPHVTLNIISRVAFSSKITSFLNGDQSSNSTSELVGAVNVIMECAATHNLQTYVPYLSKIAENPAVTHTREEKRKFSKIQEKIYEEHLASLDTSNPRDMIDRLIIAGMEKEEIIQAILDMIAAGTHTAAHTMAWGAYLMAIHPDVQKKLKQTIVNEIGSIENITADKLADVRYLHCVIQEVMRFYPLAVFAVPHQPTEDITIGGYNVPAGTIVFAHVYALLTDENIWGDPQVFRPERFLEDSSKADKLKIAYSYIPFGIGARRCLGESLAILELQCFFALAMLKDLQFSVREGFEVVEKLTLTLQPREMPIIFL